jgi:hypothetical protein
MLRMNQHIIDTSDFLSFLPLLLCSRLDFTLKKPDLADNQGI